MSNTDASTDYDVIVLGGGAPGEHCAGALAEGGLRVAVVERELVGGECSYWACIPSKTLLRPGEAVHGALDAAGTARVDVEAALAWRDFMVSNYSDAGAQRWLADRGIALLRGNGRLAGPGVVEVDGVRQAWFELADGQVRLARANGTLSWLPFVLDYLAESHIQAGELSQAAALLTESERIDPGVRAATLPYVSLLLAAWRGDAPTAIDLTSVMIRDASTRGEGAALTCVEYAKAVLYNGRGDYALAAEAAHGASAADEIVTSPWALYELVEAAVRSDQRERASAAADRLSEMAAASASDWARGAAARSRALLAQGPAADDLYREAIELLSRTRMATHLARARLVYGEWLRRENRRVDARTQLRAAYEAFGAMGVQAFCERARRELQATGEKVRQRNDNAHADLTPQETEIAQLAREGRTNPEIGAQLFISARTVEWHMGKVFAKLEISSRRELDEALRHRRRRPHALAHQP